MEVAGLVLGAVPLLLAALNQYSQGVGGRWSVIAENKADLFISSIHCVA